MAGWLTVVYEDDTHELFETLGDSRLEIGKSPVESRVLGEHGVVSVEWFAEEPKLKTKSVGEAQEEADLQAAKDAEKEAKAEEKAASSKS